MISSSTTIEDIKKKVKKDKAYYMIASKTQRDKLITDYLSEMKKLKSISSSTNDIELLSEEYNKKEFTQMLISKIQHLFLIMEISVHLYLHKLEILKLATSILMSKQIAKTNKPALRFCLVQLL